MNVTKRVQDESSDKAIRAISKVNDEFKRALQNDRPPSTFSPPWTPDRNYTVGLMRLAAKHGLVKEVKVRLDSQGWSGRESLHQKIVSDTVDVLNSRASRYVYNALAYLPFGRVDQQCRPLPEDNVADVGYWNLNFFVLYANRSSEQRANQTWEEVKDNEVARDAVLGRVFAKSNADLCGRLRTVLSDNSIKGFGGFAAVKCGYEFVWYELGYSYFYAAYSSTPYQWEMKGGAYDSKAKCGQIFFFP
ncbi:hypothetical protein AAVH_11207 [Aphelenchoides avenae]|nr:hypothetical protein AAVH_11207 [Aphelenchus avenae]